MNREIEINGYQAKDQLIALGDLVLEQMEHPSRKKIVISGLALAIGVFAVWVYYNETMAFTEDKSPSYSHFAVASSMGSNAIVNGYFNNDAVQELFTLKDPITGKMTVPSLDLLLSSAVSILSAFAFAFLVFKKGVKTSYINFCLQIVTYSAQHYFSVMSIFKSIRGFFSQIHNKTARYAKALLSQQVEGLLGELAGQFVKREYDKVNWLFSVDNQINTEKLAERILEQTIIINQTAQCNSNLGKAFYYLSHGTGLLFEALGNVGYFNSTINGYRKFFNDRTSIYLGVSTMLPMFWLSFIVSIKNIDKIAELSMKIVHKLRLGKISEIGEEFPYAIRRTPLFSTIVGSGLGVMAIFSFYTGLELFMDAVYNTHPDDDPEWFDWMDYEGKLQTVYPIAVRIAILFFNIFPVPEVTAYLSQMFCYLTGTAEDKKALKTIWVLESMQRRISLIPEKVFGFREEPQGYTLVGYTERTPRKSCCTKLTEYLRKFWPFCKSSSSQSNYEDHSINGSYYALNGTT